MPASRHVLLFSLLASAVLLPLSAAAQPRPTTIVASEPASIRAWDSGIDSMLRTGNLEVRRVDSDTLVNGRTHTRMRQLHRGVPVVGAELTRQTDDIGATVSIYGTTYPDIDIEVTPALSMEEAAAVVLQQSGVELGPSRMPTLCVFPTADGFRLAYRATAFSAEGGTAYVIDANDGSILHQTDAVERQSAVGVGTGVLGDQKKMSVTSDSGAFNARDPLRPPLLTTYDLHENLQRTLDFLNGRISLGVSDRATDTDNTWTDGAAVDAHAQTGYFYDYYFKRFGRRGLDDNNFRLLSIVHPVARSAVRTQSPAVIGTFYLNAFYYGSGVMVYGEGLPDDLTAGGQHWNYLAGALDVVAHELTHGITDFTSDLIYENEPGALNESFSDMMGTAVEFFYQQPGTGLRQADYLIAEDVVTPGGIRSMANPAAFGQPDHYSRRAVLPNDDAHDNGGVHVNSGIPNHVYFLAIEGGTNRTSGLSVQGVGQANRDQIEKAMYRGFTLMMPSNASFSVARAVTIRAATDLYGGSSAAVRALTQAWTAVGVN
jgi:Zn-dependent metalloprotease